jgi:cob(I)alamin adenosyltransferase
MLQVYTGNGKGKTTSALGLTLRAVGAGMRALFVQFMKNVPTSELESLKLFGDKVVVKRFGTGDYIIKTPAQEDYEHAETAFSEIDGAVRQGEYDLIIADEICTALFYKLIDKNKVLEMIHNCPPQVELVFTGRYADEDIINAAGLVTEMREVKHCYREGVQARAGIDY